MAPKALGSSSLASLSPTPTLYHLVSLPQHPLLRAHPQCYLSLSLFGRLCLLHVFVCSVTSGVSNSVTPWTVAHQAPLSVGFSKQEYWSGLPCPPPGIFLTQGSILHLM